MSSEVKLQRPLLWRWATEDGEPQEGSEHELVHQLESGQVPPFALVWREGWGEWLPAMQVAELSTAFPGVTPLRQARPSSVPGSIPPVPVSEYPRLRLLAKEALAKEGFAKEALLGAHNEFECPEQEVITSEVPAAALLEAARAMTEPSPPANLGLGAAIARASEPAPALTEPLFQAAEAFWGEQRSSSVGPARPLAAEFGLEGLLEAARPRQPSWSSWLRAHGVWVALGVLAVGLAGLFGARSLIASRAVRAPAPSGHRALQPPASSDVEPAPEPASAPCRLEQEPVKLDSWAVVDVRPMLLSISGSGAVALGYAQSHKHATGIRLDTSTLAFERTYGQQNERQIFSVTPLAARGTLSYHVERQGALVAFSRAIDAVPTLRFGMNDDGLVLGPLDQRAAKVWELPVGTLISVPEVAQHARGFTLALRAGRNTGHLRLGLLGPTGTPLSPLEQIGTPESEYGRPALASGAEQTVLAVTLQPGADGPTQLLIGRAPNGQLPLELTPLDIFGEESVELSSPALAALPDGGFALMWTQGSTWRRQIRVQLLSSTLAPMGVPLDVSTPDPALGGATAGALFWASDRLLALYFSRRDEGHSLWVAKLGCSA